MTEEWRKDGWRLVGNALWGEKWYVPGDSTETDTDILRRWAFLKQGHSPDNGPPEWLVTRALARRVIVLEERLARLETAEGVEE